MRGVKQEPGAPVHQTRTMPLRHATPICIDDTTDATAEASGAPSSANTDATFPSEDARNTDVAMSDLPIAEDPLYLFGRKGRELIHAVKKLDYLGIDTTIPSLPKVVVVGDQSAGKSSIIEAISDITLPRSEGTCTRCPFQITTHASQDGDLQWSCTVTLQYKFTYEPGYAEPSYAGDTLAGWRAYGSIEVCQFETITDKAELELVLRRAQVAILNPSRNWKNFVALSATDVAKATYQVDFSPNVIGLEINAPNLAELSFYDLPGAINVMNDSSQDYLSDFVKTLLKSYLSDDQALVVIACPANQDIETVTAFRYLRRCKAESRAVGVLTKPDLIDPTKSRIENLERMFRGEAFKLDGGWYTTKQLSQSQLNGPLRPTYDEARAEETLFFSKAPWSTRLSDFSDRFGVANFQAAVSKKHIQHILASLPDIVGRIQERLQEVEHELKGYPGKAANPGLEIIHDIDNVVKAIVGQCSADSKTSSFRESQKKHMKHLAKQLEAAAPKVDLRTPGYVSPAVDISDDEGEPDETPSKRNKSANGRAISVTPRRAPPSCSQAPLRTPTTGSKRKAPVTPIQAQNIATSSICFRLDEIKRRFDLAPSAHMPDDADVRITCDLAKESLTCFSTVTQQALDRFKDLVTSMLDNCLTDSLAQRKGTGLFKETGSIMQSLFLELFGKEVDSLHHFVACTTHRPITYGRDWAGKRADQHQKLRQGRDEARVSEHFEVLEARGFKVPTTAEERKKKIADAAWMSTNISSPDYARELKELSMPLTFYELSSSQLVDTIARNLDYLIYQLEDCMKTRLLNGLRPNDFEHSASLLVEDPAREARRSELEAEQSRLEEALNELNVLSSAEA